MTLNIYLADMEEAIQDRENREQFRRQDFVLSNAPGTVHTQTVRVHYNRLIIEFRLTDPPGHFEPVQEGNQFGESALVWTANDGSRAQRTPLPQPPSRCAVRQSTASILQRSVSITNILAEINQARNNLLARQNARLGDEVANRQESQLTTPRSIAGTNIRRLQPPVSLYMESSARSRESNEIRRALSTMQARLIQEARRRERDSTTTQPSSAGTEVGGLEPSVAPRRVVAEI